ncbi:unnamed protein product [Lactuca saligna]|uniref:Uncharacterized protein n=1 Tax=Lactuca saligna TaxID=75948 RepID=A0AA35VNC9_LACSI|nr:unnamed protein product [Lactuca saligna]
MATPPPSPYLISLNSRDRMNFSDIHTIFYDCGERMAETQVEVNRIKEEIGCDFVISRVEMVAMQRRLDRNEKKMHAMTVVVVALVMVTISLMIEKIHALI